MKGLLVDVLRPANGSDFTNGGMSSRYTRAILAGEGVAAVFEPDETTPLLILVRRNLRSSRTAGRVEYLHAEPADKPAGKWMMFGGNYITDSDSRFPSDYPIPVHDRTE